MQAERFGVQGYGSYLGLGFRDVVRGAGLGVSGDMADPGSGQALAEIAVMLDMQRNSTWDPKP